MRPAGGNHRLFKEWVERWEIPTDHFWTMSLILDHINGVPDDNRLENLRIVCPNCAATLDTHCGRKNRREPEVRSCKRCGREFQAKYGKQRYCSHSCGTRWDRSKFRGRPQPGIRRVSARLTSS